VVALLVVGAGAWFVFAGASSAEAAQVQLEATSTSGPSPFTAPVGEDTAGVVAPANAQGSQPGNTGGLYAQDPAKASCDTASLVNQLSADPSRGAAWAKSLGIEESGIGGFVNTLSAVSLRADTNVTAYGYGGGQFQPYPATLQAGTAVLVNSYGEPTVKCYSGDPLGPPTDSNNSASLVGVPWNGFVRERTIIVTPAPAPITQIVVVDPGNKQTPKPMPPNPDPKKNPGPPTTKGGQLLLTGTHNYDGTVTLSDGRILGTDGKILPPRVNATFPPGTVTLADGGHKLPNGVVLNIDGTTRNPVTVGGVTIQPDGTTQVLPDGRIVHFNYDGTILIVKPGAGGGVAVLNPDGTTKSVGGVVAGIVVNPDGSFTTPDGKIHNADGSVRAPQTLPDGTILDPTGGNTPPSDAKVDKTMQGTDGTLGTENKLLKGQEAGQTGPGQPGPGAAPGTNGQPGQAGQTACTPAGTPATPGVPACPPAPAKTVCVPGSAATPVCPAVPDKSTKGTSTEGGSASGTGTGSDTGTGGTGSGSGSSGSGSGSSGSSSGGESGGSSSGG
jgi:hypothetical protein